MCLNILNFKLPYCVCVCVCAYVCVCVLFIYLLLHVYANITRPRPIKIVTSTPQERKKILEASKKLKNEDGIFKKIYLNKDIHPLIRKELNRIRWVEKQEKGKPENAGRTVKYDHESRCVTVDDLVVDRFKPMFF